MKKEAKPLYLQLADTLAAAIGEGTYRVGDKLPSIRELRRKTRLSISTISRALSELERRGVVEARTKSNYVVTPARKLLPTPRAVTAVARPRLPRLHELTEAIVAQSIRTDLVALGGTVISPELLPGKTLNRLARQALHDQPSILEQYSDPCGLPSLRRELARRMFHQNTRWSPDDLIITRGCMSAIHLSLLAVAKAGDAIVVETPTFFGHLQALRDLGLRAVEVPVHPATGIDLDNMEAAVKKFRVRAALVVPNFQNPCGALMPDAYKLRLLALAQRHDFAVIENDVYGELYHGSVRPSTLASHDCTGRVLYCSSVSKTLSPGLRIGWVAPGRYLEQARALSLSSGICCPELNQSILRLFLAIGGYDRHLARLRHRLHLQTEDLARAVQRHFPATTRLSQPQGGFFLWVELDPGTDSEALYHTAMRHRIAILPGVVCSLNRRHDHCIRLTSGQPWTGRCEEAIRLLARLVTKPS